MRSVLCLSLILLAAPLAGCVVPENMTALREELGYASVDLPDVVVKARPDTLEPKVQETITLTATVEGIETDLVTVTWELGDGTSAQGTTVEHAWEDPGQVEVTVTATPPEGPAASDTVTLHVGENQVPLPAITVEDRDGLVDGDTVVLTAVDSQDPDGDPLTYTWTIDGEAEHTGPRVQTELAAGAHTVKLTATDGWDTVSIFDAFGVSLPITGQGDLTALEDTLEVPFSVSKDAGTLTVELTHTTTQGLDDVQLTLLDSAGDPVATSQSEPALGQGEATETLSVPGNELAPGTYTLQASLVRGVTSQVTLDGLLTYAP